MVSCVGAPRISGAPVALAVLAIAWQWGHRCVMIVAVLAEIPPRAFGETVRGDVVSDRRLASTITVGGATNAGTFEAAELMVAGMNAREASGVLFEQNLVVADSESTRRRLATATTKHLSFLEDDALRFVANRD